ncbi:MAG TPA: NAD(P)-dependent oxidoreductase [Turneriella sp.]|nr:NAD(P)-dependent oxidoreductase [Turneriella sp.]
MLVLFQEGIPDIFFPALRQKGITVQRVPTGRTAAIAACRRYASAEAIFFRANFTIDKELLEALPQLRLAALVSTGSDNVDVHALAERQIRFVSGEGANAQAVCDYVLQALCFGGFNFARESLGVVGAGRVGSRLLKLLGSAGVRVSYFDPLLADPGSLEEVLQCDVVTFHTFLSREGTFATAGMLDARYFAPVKKKLRLIQASRGGVWNTDFYRSLASHPHIEILAQDVYPGEPPRTSDLSLARYSTPHVAGYSTFGRLGGIAKGIQVLLTDFSAEALLPAGRAWFLDEEAQRFTDDPSAFNDLRDNYGWRKEFWQYNDEERAAWLTRFPQAPQSCFGW